MSAPFVRPHSETIHHDGDGVKTLGVGGLYGMDMENVDEDWDTEPLEPEERRDLGDPAGHSAEAQDARVKSSPARPSADEVARHDVTHVPYRSWCPICVAASAREDRHPRQTKIDTEEGLPVIHADYDLLEDDLTLLIVKDKQSGAALAYDCETKGPGDTWIVKQLTKDLAVWGRTDICLMSDGEPAMTAFQQAVALTRPRQQTVLRNSPLTIPNPMGGPRKQRKMWSTWRGDWC